jgi:hypothetical protein
MEFEEFVGDFAGLARERIPELIQISWLMDVEEIITDFHPPVLSRLIVFEEIITDSPTRAQSASADFR